MVEFVRWTDATAVRSLGQQRFSAHVDEQWTSLQGVHGGVVAAIAVNASAAVLSDEGIDPASQLRAATFGYVSGNTVGKLTVDVEVVRRGRAMTTTQARVRQGEKTTTLARFHYSTPWDGMEFSDVGPPRRKPGDAVRLDVSGPAHLDNTETYLDPRTTFFGGAERAEWVAWSRPVEGGSFDAAWLTMFGDFFPPTVFARTTGPVRAVTIEYSIQIHSAAGSWSLADGEYLAARMHAFHSHDGFAVEDGWIHLPDGTLLATTRQTRLAG
jgi:acyl-CoA thioesterase